MSSVFVLAHKRTVGSGRLLADAIGAKCITPKYAKSVPPDSMVINYGVSELPPFLQNYQGEIINGFIPIKRAINKLITLDTLRTLEIPTLEFTTNYSEAYDYLKSGHSSRRKVFARSLLCSSGGKGIIVISDTKEITPSVISSTKFYTRNFPKNKEFRVHVINGDIVHISQKKAMSEDKMKEMGLEGKPDRYIRNYSNGWVFTTEGIQDQGDIGYWSRKAVVGLGLDFGAVDIMAICKGDEVKQIAVCEVNTAPSLSGISTIEAYQKAFIKNFLS